MRVHDEPVRRRRVHQHGRIVPVRVSVRVRVGLDREEVRGRERVQDQRERVRQRDVYKSARRIRMYLRGRVRPGTDSGNV